MKKQTDREIERLLKTAGLRMTVQRVAIVSALMRASMPLSREQIAAAISPAAPNKTTIYRVLETLVGKGIVHKAFLRERTWHFELAHNCSPRQCHPHFTCTTCGDTHCLPGMAVPMAKSPPGGFVIDRQRIQLEGLCPKCSAAS